MEKLIQQSEIRKELREIISMEKNRKEDYAVSSWNNDKQEGYIKALNVILELFI